MNRPLRDVVDVSAFKDHRQSRLIKPSGSFIQRSALSLWCRRTDIFVSRCSSNFYKETTNFMRKCLMASSSPIIGPQLYNRQQLLPRPQIRFFLLLMRSGSVRYGKTRHSGLLSVLYVLLLLLLLLLLLADSHEHITTKWFPTEVQWKNQNWISTNPQETAMIAEKELQKGLPWSHRRVTPINSTPFKSKWNPGKNPREWYIFTRVTKRAID